MSSDLLEKEKSSLTGMNKVEKKVNRQISINDIIGVASVCESDEKVRLLILSILICISIVDSNWTDSFS